MKLGEIRDYLKQRGQVSVQDVATHFDIATTTAQFALDYWLKKGLAREKAGGCQSGGCGGGCHQDGVASMSYEWVKRAVPLQFVPFRSVSS